MISQPIEMDAELGRLILGLIPVRVNQDFTAKDKSFQQILSILGVEGKIAEERYENISIEIEAAYSFEGIENLPSGGFAAVYISRFWVCPIENGSDSGWNVERFGRYDRFYGALNKILKTEAIIKNDIPDIEMTSLVEITSSGLVEKEKYWRVRR